MKKLVSAAPLGLKCGTHMNPLDFVCYCKIAQFKNLFHSLKFIVMA